MSSAPSVILAVEDCPDLTRLIPRQIAAFWPATSCVVAETFAMAHDMVLKGHQVDIVLLDLYLPDSEGLDTLRAMTDILHPTVPIVVMSGMITPLEGLTALSMGADAFLRKGSMSLDQLREALVNAWFRKLGSEERRGACCETYSPLLAQAG